MPIIPARAGEPLPSLWLYAWSVGGEKSTTQSGVADLGALRNYQHGGFERVNAELPWLPHPFGEVAGGDVMTSPGWKHVRLSRRNVTGSECVPLQVTWNDTQLLIVLAGTPTAVA